MIAPTAVKRLGTGVGRRSFVSSVLSSPSVSLPGGRQSDLDHAVQMVKEHDPSGYLPGRLLPTSAMVNTYYATRGFWVETGLRFGSTALVEPHSPPEMHLDFWKCGIDSIYDGKLSHDHSTLRLLAQLVAEYNLTKYHFDDILEGRYRDIDLKQYPTMDSLEEHAELSCGSLAQLVLESDGIFERDGDRGRLAHHGAKLIGKAHGLTNALRTSIPVISTTGKLIIPEDLCKKHGVKSPRYLLSALGQGDKQCIQALRLAVEDISNRARSYLRDATNIIPEISKSSENAATVLLPGLASATFLDRLESHDFDLTNKSLRHVHWTEKGKCALRMIAMRYKPTRSGQW